MAPLTWTRDGKHVIFASERESFVRFFDQFFKVPVDGGWVETLLAGESSGLELTGWAVDSPDDSPDVGHKTMAKMLVRLADLEQLMNVWLTSSAKSEYEEQPALEYTVTAIVSVPTTGSDTP